MMDHDGMLELVDEALRAYDPNETIHPLALLKTTRYFMLMDFNEESIAEATQDLDNLVWTIYYAYKLDINEGPIKA